MAVNVTYLLGAGASFGAIPLVKEVNIDSKVIKRSLSKEIQKFSQRLADGLVGLDEEKSTTINKVIDDINHVGTQSAFFSSPDTYARSLHLNRKDSEIQKVKQIISLYRTWKQLNDTKLIDKRYIPFLAGILEQEGGVQLPSHIKILSWNYDFQFELALEHYRPDISGFSKIQEHFKITPSKNSVSNPSMIHLNGVAGMFKDSKGTYFTSTPRNEKKPETEYLLNIVLEDYTQWTTRGHGIGDLLTFAWEIDSHSRIFEAISIMQQTEILVVIGYSFPFFNRQIDQVLLKAFKQNLNGRSKIYIQDPSINQNQLAYFKERFDTGNITIIPISSVDQFFLPPEL